MQAALAAAHRSVHGRSVVSGAMCEPFPQHARVPPRPEPPPSRSSAPLRPIAPMGRHNAELRDMAFRSRTGERDVRCLQVCADAVDICIGCPMCPQGASHARAAVCSQSLHGRTFSSSSVIRAQDQEYLKRCACSVMLAACMSPCAVHGLTRGWAQHAQHRYLGPHRLGQDHADRTHSLLHRPYP